jgi:hypothetical protein
VGARLHRRIPLTQALATQRTFLGRHRFEEKHVFRLPSCTNELPQLINAARRVQVHTPDRLPDLLTDSQLFAAAGRHNLRGSTFAAPSKSRSVVRSVSVCRMQSCAINASIVSTCTPFRRQPLRSSAAAT